MKNSVYKSKVTCFQKRSVFLFSAIVIGGLFFSSTLAISATSSEEYLRSGLEKSFQGDFGDAQEILEKAKQDYPENKRINSTLDMISAYMKFQKQSEKRSLQRYLYERDRVLRLMIVDKYLPELEKLSFIEELRKLIKTEFIESYNLIPPVLDLEDIDEGIDKKKKDGLAAIKKLPAIVTKAIALLKNEKTDFAKELCSVATELTEKLEKYAALWAALDVSSPLKKYRSLKTLRVQEIALADSVTSMEAMMAEKPWKIALLHMRIAKMLFNGDLKTEKWVEDFIPWVEAHIKEAKAAGDWDDLLSAANALKEMMPSELKYRNLIKEGLRHSRVIHLYGAEEKTAKSDGSKAETRPGKIKEPQEDEKRYWKKLTENVDAQMARKAISRLKSGYVANIDFMKLNRGGLEAVKMLAETSEAFGTFKGLNNETNRKAYINGIVARIKNLERKDRVDGITLQQSLNWAMSHSEDTVNIPTEVIVLEFVNGLLTELDQFSRMIWPYNIMEFKKSTMGHFTGIGVQIRKEPGEPLIVITPLTGSPAIEAGLKAGDEIIKVNEDFTKDKQIDYLVKRITGKENTTVVLTVKRRGVREPFKVSVVRRRVHIQTVEGWGRSSGGKWKHAVEVFEGEKIGYIRLKQFTKTSHTDIENILKDFVSKGIDSIVLDLRDNPGGLLSSAAQIVDEFVKAGVVVYTKGRMQKRRDLTASMRGTYPEGKGRMAILVNDNSASASEIVSGALQCLGRAVVVGERSYGKGSVQNLVPVMGDDALLKLTTAHYYLANDRLLHRKPESKDWGINPEVVVKLTPRRRGKIIRLHRRIGLLKDYGEDIRSEQLKELYKADLQFQAAALILKLQKVKAQVDAEFKVGMKKAV